MHIFFNLLISLFLLLSFTSCGGGSSSSKESNTTLPLSSNISDNNTSTENNHSTPSSIIDIPATKEEALESTEKFFSVPYPEECTLEKKNKFVYDVMHDSYLFATSTETLEYNNSTYNEPEKVLEAFRHKNDRYSFIMDSQTLLDFYTEGKNKNFGFDFFYTPVEGVSYYYFIVSYVYPNSPASNAGLKRGDIITSVNNLTISNIDETLSIYEIEDTITFQVWNTTLQQNRDVTVTKAEYSVRTVLDARILEENNQKVGYIVFQDFITQAIDELNYYFGVFKSEGVEELILDLRYNGGGEVSVANHLATLIGGEHVYGKVFEEVNFNEKYALYNFKEYFGSSNKNVLNLKRVFIIGTQSTASSSELVINALKALDNDVEVVQIGSTTFGKPYGFYPTLFCDKALLLVNVESKNSDGVGGYTNGLEPTCSANDDLFKAFGDREEASLKEALYYISNGDCNPLPTVKSKQNGSIFKAFALEKKGFKQIMTAY
ncbi:MAG: PDZ domain-containing protein [Epsilonproteobacteria bacterium]|nr:PDZ domain-containing protein [Campylobacterota bacterium]